MTEPFISEIQIFAFNFAPRGWAMCNGQLLPINQNQALFSLLGTTYGGDGRVNFALPNLQGRIPLHLGDGFTQGEAGGEYAHSLNHSELPAHNHLVTGSNATATTLSGPGNLWANGNVSAYAASPDTALNPASVQNTGGSQAHENMPPYLVLNFCIAIQGVFPSRW